MQNINWLELLGYLASAIVIVSILMSSILKLRIFNLIGSVLFSVYGFLIGAIPVGFVNGFIALINIYYLSKMLGQKEFFRTLNVRGDNYYLKEFLSFYKDDIAKYFPKFKYEPEKNRYSFFVLRNMNVAGIFMAREFDQNTLWITLDFAIPQYRDFKVGKFVFKDNVDMFRNDGYSRLIAYSVNKKHSKYLEKMGFKKEKSDGQTVYVKNI